MVEVVVVEVEVVAEVVKVAVVVGGGGRIETIVRQHMTPVIEPMRVGARYQACEAGRRRKSQSWLSFRGARHSR